MNNFFKFQTKHIKYKSIRKELINLEMSAYVVKLPRKITKKGSVPLENGKTMQFTSNEIYIMDRHSDKIQVDKKRKVIWFRIADLHFDVAKPRFNWKNGNIVKPPRIWLSDVPFTLLGAKLQAEARNNQVNSLLEMFNKKED